MARCCGVSQPALPQEFYRVMRDALGMLTAFPLGEFADRYYQEAASSSVATAISLGAGPPQMRHVCTWRPVLRLRTVIGGQTAVPVSRTAD